MIDWRLNTIQKIKVFFSDDTIMHGMSLGLGVNGSILFGFPSIVLYCFDKLSYLNMWIIIILGFIVCYLVGLFWFNNHSYTPKKERWIRDNICLTGYYE